jgi:uncharacterized membrane protein (DUF106 family)
VVIVPVFCLWFDPLLLQETLKKKALTLLCMVGGFQVFIDTIFNPVFGWLLNIPSLVAIIILAFTLGLVSTLLQKYLTDQAKLKRLREDTKKLQEQIKKATKDKDMNKLSNLQEKIMPIQVDMIKETFKPIIVTMVPFLLIFFWLSNHFAYHEIRPDVPFTVSAQFKEGVGGTVTLDSPLLVDDATKQVSDGVARWTLKGPAGEHSLNLTYAGATLSRKVLISEERIYESPAQPFEGPVSSFNIDNERLIPIPGFNLFGWYPGWIFYYIIFSIPLSLLLKKVLNVV